MSIRYRRKRVLIISIVALLALIYFVNTKTSHNEETYLLEQKLRQALARSANEPNGDNHTQKIIKPKRVTRVKREETVEIDGKQYRKIDWHDYEQIEQENARTGR